MLFGQDIEAGTNDAPFAIRNVYIAVLAVLCLTGTGYREWADADALQGW